MSTFSPLPPSPIDVPIPINTRVTLDERATFIDRGLLAGGSPWRLMRLKGTSRSVVERWRHGDVVRAGEERLARTLIQQGLVHPHFDPGFSIDDIDVVVPVFNDALLLASLLDQLKGFHVCVVDDGSNDAIEVARIAGAHGVSIVRVDENRGPAHARNVGAGATARRLLWFIDVDVSLESALEVARTLHSSFADPMVGATAPRVRGANGVSRREKFEHHFGALDLGDRSGLVVAGSAIGYVPSACLMVRRDSFAEGFDETIRIGEDVDFVWRMHDRGWLVRYDADALVEHRSRNTWRQWWLQRHRYGESSAALATRHGTRLAPLRVDTWTLVAWTSVLVGQPALGARIVRSARRHARDRYFGLDDDPDRAATQIVAKNMVHAGGPLLRALTRTFGIVVLLCALHPRLRRRALIVFALGTGWRWRHHRFDVLDVPLAVADDLAYGTGVFRGAWKERSLRSLTPQITRSTMGVREAFGQRSLRP